MTSRFFDPPRPRLFAHRGSAGTHPENTLPAFRAALDSGLLYLEMDVRATRDGRIVVHHDATLERTCGDPRRVEEVDWPDLRQFDAGLLFAPERDFPFRGQGIRVPLLEEVLEEFPEACCTVEIKQEHPPIEEEVLAILAGVQSQDRVLLASEKDAVLRRVRPHCGGIPTSFGFGEVAEFLEWAGEGCPAGYRPPGRALQIPEIFGETRLVTPETVGAAHGAGLEVHVWTVNEEEDMRRLLEMGVDGLIGDFPERLKRVTGER